MRVSVSGLGIEILIGRGYQVTIHNSGVDPEKLIGVNRSYLERELPHIASIMRPSIDEVPAQADVVVVANSSDSFRELRRRMKADQILIDLVGITEGEAKREVEREKAA